jgi:protocatechuate 3,4-dioxygenase beta subunit
MSDEPLLLDRRRALLLLGGFGMATIVGCGSDGKASSAASTTSTTAGAATTAATAGSVIPEETAGPYPGDGSNGPDVLAEGDVVRSDIRKSIGSASGTADGVPLSIEVTVVDATSASAPISGAAVYVWHCDREGNYSLYGTTADENYLRGVQPTGADGKATFTSIFPACYAGRWPHIHFEVYESVKAATSGGHRIATSQIALPQDTCAAVYGTAGYERSVQNLSQVSLARDNVFGDDGGVHELGTVTRSGSGYKVALTVPVDPSATSSGGAGGGPGGPMGGR